MKGEGKKMAKRRWRIQAHFAGIDALQVIEVESGSWPSAMGKAARALRASPALKGKRPKAASFTIQAIGRASADAPAVGYQEQPEQQTLPSAPAEQPEAAPARAAEAGAEASPPASEEASQEASPPVVEGGPAEGPQTN